MILKLEFIVLFLHLICLFKHKHKQIVYIYLRVFFFSKAFSAIESTFDVNKDETEPDLSARITCVLMTFCPRLVFFSFIGPMCITRTFIYVFFIMQSGWLTKFFKGISPCRKRIRMYGIFNKFHRFAE